jgi:thiol-disulfide isomerase/thioredoxin
LVSVVAACGDDGDTSESAASASAPDFSAETLDGGELASADLDGPTVLWFWAPWCTICRAEAPNVVDGAATLGDDVTVIGVAGRGEVEAMDEFVADTGTGALTHVVDDDGSIWAAYGVTSQPAFAFIDADGTLDEVVIGAIGQDGLVDRATALAG